MLLAVFLCVHVLYHFAHSSTFRQAFCWSDNPSDGGIRMDCWDKLAMQYMPQAIYVKHYL
jgi:hypothetical protein